MTRTRLAGIALAAAMALAGSAFGQATDTLVRVDHNGYTVSGTAVPPGPFLECRGTPTCVSTYQSTISIPSCPGSYTFYLTTTMSGLNLSGTSLQGTIVQQVATPGGCTTINNIDYSFTYSGTFNPATRTGSITIVGPTCSFQGADICVHFIEVQRFPGFGDPL